MRIYLDIDGTLIHEDLGNSYGKPAEGLAEFIRAPRPFETYWRATHCTWTETPQTHRIVKAHLTPALNADIDRSNLLTGAW